MVCQVRRKTINVRSAYNRTEFCCRFGCADTPSAQLVHHQYFEPIHVRNVALVCKAALGICASIPIDLLPLESVQSLGENQQRVWAAMHEAGIADRLVVEYRDRLCAVTDWQCEDPCSAGGTDISRSALCCDRLAVCRYPCTAGGPDIFCTHGCVNALVRHVAAKIWFPCRGSSPEHNFRTIR